MKKLNVTDYARGLLGCPGYDTVKAQVPVPDVIDEIKTPSGQGRYYHALIAYMIDNSRKKPRRISGDDYLYKEAEGATLWAKSICSKLKVEQQCSYQIDTQRGPVVLTGVIDAYGIQDNTLYIIDYKHSIHHDPVYTTQAQLYAQLITQRLKQYIKTVKIYIHYIDGTTDTAEYGWGEVQNQLIETKSIIKTLYSSSPLTPCSQCDVCAHRMTCKAALQQAVADIQSILYGAGETLTEEEITRLGAIVYRLRGLPDEAIRLIPGLDTTLVYNAGSEAARRAAAEIYKEHPEEVKLSVSQDTIEKYKPEILKDCMTTKRYAEHKSSIFERVLGGK